MLVAGLGPASGLGELAALGVGAVGDRVGEVVGCVRDGVVGDVEVVGGDGMVGVDRRAEVFLGCCSVRCPRLHFYASSTRFRHCLLFLFFLLFWLCYRYGYDGDDDVLLPGLGLDVPVVPGRARVLVPGSLDVLHMVSAAGLWVEAGELGGFGEVPDWGPVLEFGSLPLLEPLEWLELASMCCCCSSDPAGGRPTPCSSPPCHARMCTWSRACSSPT